MDKDTKMLVGLGVGIGLLALLGFAGKASAATDVPPRTQDDPPPIPPAEVKTGSEAVGLVVGEDQVELDPVRYATTVFDLLDQGFGQGDIDYDPRGTEFQRTVQKNVATAWVITQLPSVGINLEGVSAAERASVIDLTNKITGSYLDALDEEEAISREGLLDRVFRGLQRGAADVWDGATRLLTFRPSTDNIVKDW